MSVFSFSCFQHRARCCSGVDKPKKSPKNPHLQSPERPLKEIQVLVQNAMDNSPYKEIKPNEKITLLRKLIEFMELRKTATTLRTNTCNNRKEMIEFQENLGPYKSSLCSYFNKGEVIHDHFIPNDFIFESYQINLANRAQSSAKTIEDAEKEINLIKDKNNFFSY